MVKFARSMQWFGAALVGFASALLLTGGSFINWFTLIMGAFITVSNSFNEATARINRERRR